MIDIQIFGLNVVSIDKEDYKKKKKKVNNFHFDEREQWLRIAGPEPYINTRHDK